jgi:hypothetical protein
VLPRTISFELLETVARRDSQILQRRGTVDDQELLQGLAMKGRREALRSVAREEGFGLSLCKGLDHRWEYSAGRY